MNREDKIAKIQSLVERGATAGEREAARRALDRMGATVTPTRPRVVNPYDAVFANYASWYQQQQQGMANAFNQQSAQAGLYNQMLSDLYRQAGMGAQKASQWKPVEYEVVQTGRAISAFWAYPLGCAAGSLISLFLDKTYSMAILHSSIVAVCLGLAWAMYLERPKTIRRVKL